MRAERERHLQSLFIGLALLALLIPSFLPAKNINGQGNPCQPSYVSPESSGALIGWEKKPKVFDPDRSLAVFLPEIHLFKNLLSFSLPAFGNSQVNPALRC